MVGVKGSGGQGGGGVKGWSDGRWWRWGVGVVGVKEWRGQGVMGSRDGEVKGVVGVKGWSCRSPGVHGGG